MSKYQVGDKVRVRNDLVNHERYAGTIFVSAMKQYCGKILTISCVNAGYYHVKENDWYWSDEMFEGKVENMFTKSDLETGMVVTVRCGTKYTVMLGFVNEESKKDILIHENGWLDLEYSFDNSLLCKDHDYDVVKVEKLNFCGYYKILNKYNEDFFTTVWEREEKPKEINLTVAVIKHFGLDKPYWFEVPDDVKVSKGDTILVDTAQGKDTGEVKQVLKFKTQADLDEYIKDNHVVGPKFPLKKVIGIVRKQ